MGFNSVFKGLIKHTMFKYKCQLYPSVFYFKYVQRKQSVTR